MRAPSRRRSRRRPLLESAAPLSGDSSARCSASVEALPVAACRRRSFGASAVVVVAALATARPAAAAVAAGPLPLMRRDAPEELSRTFGAGRHRRVDGEGAVAGGGLSVAGGGLGEGRGTRRGSTDGSSGQNLSTGGATASAAPVSTPHSGRGAALQAAAAAALVELGAAAVGQQGRHAARQAGASAEVTVVLLVVNLVCVVGIIVGLIAASLYYTKQTNPDEYARRMLTIHETSGAVQTSLASGYALTAGALAAATAGLGGGLGGLGGDAASRRGSRARGRSTYRASVLSASGMRSPRPGTDSEAGDAPSGAADAAPPAGRSSYASRRKSRSTTHEGASDRSENFSVLGLDTGAEGSGGTDSGDGPGRPGAAAIPTRLERSDS